MTEAKLILPLYPVTDITIGPLPEHRMIVVRPDFLSPAPATPASNSAASAQHQTGASQVPQQGRTYVLSRSQAQYLQEQLQRSLQILDADGSAQRGTQTGSHLDEPGLG